MHGACSLAGVTLRPDRLLPRMWRAVRRGFVSLAHANLVSSGLRGGFTYGIDPTRLRGKRSFQNYPMDDAAMSGVDEALQQRLAIRVVGSETAD